MMAQHRLGIRSYSTRGRNDGDASLSLGIPAEWEEPLHESEEVDMSLDANSNTDTSFNSNPPGKDEQEKSRYRLVDFLTLRREYHNPLPDRKVVVVSVEIKPLPEDPSRSPINTGSRYVEKAFNDDLLCQVIQQVQFLFHEYRHQDIVTALAGVGDWCQFMVFEQSNTPQLPNCPAPKDRYRPQLREDVTTIPTYRSRIIRVVDYKEEGGVACSDYSAEFRMEWAKAMNRVPLTAAASRMRL